MKAKITFPIVLALGLAATNWTSSKNYDREFGITSEGIDPALLGGIFCCAAIYFLGGRSLKSIAVSFRTGVKSIKKKKAEFVFSALLLSPLFLRIHESTSGNLTDGTSYTHTISFGTDHSWLLFFLGLVTIIFFQNQIEDKNNLGEPVGGHNSGQRSAPASA